MRPAAQPTLLGHALNLLAGVAVRYRDLFGDPNPPTPWSLIGALSYDHLLAHRSAHDQQRKSWPSHAQNCPAVTAPMSDHRTAQPC